MNRSPNWIVAIWVSAFALLIANAAVSFYNLEVLTANDRAVNHSRETSRAIRQVLTSVIDAEAGHRGYVITGRDEYLIPFRTSDQATPDLLNQLRTVASDDPFHADRIEVLAGFIQEKYVQMRKSLELLELMGKETASEYIQRGRGKETMDQVRDLAAEMLTHEEEQLGIRSAVAQRRYESASFTTVVGGSITVVMVGMAYLVIRRELARRQQAEQTLRESEHRFRTLTEAIPQMVWNCDQGGRITYVNERWLEYTGHPATELPVFWWTEMVHPDDVAAIDSAWKQASSLRPVPFEVEVRMRLRDDGSYRWFLCTAVPLLRDDGRVEQWIGALSSIDEQKRRSEILGSLVKIRTDELEATNAQLREEIDERRRAEARAEATSVELKRSNEELEKFAYVASHDLQEPLRKIQSFGDRLYKTAKDSLGPNGVDYVERMKGAATRMRTLIDDLLAFSRVATKGNPFVNVDLNAVVEEVLSDLEVQVAQTSGHVDVGALPVVQADPMQMRQLFQNMIGNALKFHKPDVPPSVTIDCERWENLSGDSDPQLPVGQGFRIRIIDNGIGFDQSYADRVFEVFQRLHGRGEYEGTGIGLAICRKIVERHQGMINVRSRVGEGTRFVIDLPIITADDERPRSGSEFSAIGGSHIDANPGVVPGRKD